MTTEIEHRLLELCQNAELAGELPIAALITDGHQILSEAANQTEEKQSFLAHAELMALQKAEKKMASKYLVGAELYVTMEPCEMCWAAIRLARIKVLHYYLPNEKFGGLQGSSNTSYFPTQINRISSEAFEARYRQMLSRFFKAKRKHSD